MRVLAVGFAAYVAAIVALSALAVYFLLPLAAGLRATDKPVALATVAPAPPGVATPAREASPPAPRDVAAEPARDAPTLADTVAIEDAPAPATPVAAPAPIEDAPIAAAADEAAPEPEIEWSRIA